MWNKEEYLTFNNMEYVYLGYHLCDIVVGEISDIGQL